MRIDHNTKSLRFGMDMSFSYKDDTPEGPHVQVCFYTYQLVAVYLFHRVHSTADAIGDAVQPADSDVSSSPAGSEDN